MRRFLSRFYLFRGKHVMIALSRRMAKFGAVANIQTVLFLLRRLLQRHQDEERDYAQERSHADVTQEMRAQDHAAEHDGQGEEYLDHKDEAQLLP
jgi:hypothetical protein